MKNINDIQDLIRNKSKLCIFADYNHLANNLSQLYYSEARINQYYRIIENLAALPFIDIKILSETKISQKRINKLKSKLKNIDFFLYEKNSFIETCNNIDEKTTFLYIGDNEDIININQFQNGYTILITSSKINTCKTVDFTLRIQEFADIITEINNLYL